MQGLTPGRVCHYIAYGTPGGEYEAKAGRDEVSSGGAHRAAIMTDIIDQEYGVVSLCILNPTGVFFAQKVPHFEAEEHMPGSWHFPERT